MRDVTKSAFSFSWAMSLFGVQQVLDLMRPSKATKAFDNVTAATEAEMGDALKATFKAGDNLQKGLVDIAFGVFTGQTLNPSEWMRMTSDVMNQSADAVSQGLRATVAGAKQASSGWGAAPASGQEQAPNPRAAAGPGAASDGWGPMPSASASDK